MPGAALTTVCVHHVLMHVIGNYYCFGRCVCVCVRFIVVISGKMIWCVCVRVYTCVYVYVCVRVCVVHVHACVHAVPVYSS